MSEIETPSELHYRYHRRYWQLYLLFCAVMAIGTVVAVFIPDEKPSFVLVPAAVVFMLMLGLRLVVRGRDPKEHDEEHRRIAQDEWIALSRSKASRDALLTVIFVQVPLMFFMALVPPEPSVVGMGMMTTALGCGVYTASFLRRIKPSDDE